MSRAIKSLFSFPIHCTSFLFILGFTTISAASEFASNLTPRAPAVIAETFGDDRNKPWWQSGLRWSLVPNLLQIDATIGQQAGGARAGQWLSFGLRWTP